MVTEFTWEKLFTISIAAITLLTLLTKTIKSLILSRALVVKLVNASKYILVIFVKNSIWRTKSSLEICLKHSKEEEDFLLTA